MRANRVTICGPSGTGKTVLFKLLQDKDIPEFSRSTRVSSHCPLEYQIDPDHKVTVNLWDTGGDRLLRNLSEVYIVNIDLAILIFDLSSSESFDTTLGLSLFESNNITESNIFVDDDSNNRSWLESLRIKSPKCDILIVGNKKDIKTTCISDETIAQKIQAIKNRFPNTIIEYMEISCLTPDQSQNKLNPNTEDIQLLKGKILELCQSRKERLLNAINAEKTAQEAPKPEKKSKKCNIF